MQLDRFQRVFGGLSEERQSKLLVGISAMLTIVGREAYPEATADMSVSVRLKKLRGVNEIQHLVCGQLSALMRGCTERYPDEVFCDSLFETAVTHDLESRLIWCLDQVTRSA